MNLKMFQRMNKTTIISLISGLMAVIPYLAMTLVYFLMASKFTETIGTILAFIIIETAFFYFISGVIWGAISLITGTVAINQIRKKQGPETNFRLAIIGILLGTSGIIANLIFNSIVLLGMLMAD